MSDYTNPLFANRHIGPDSDAVAAMLEVIGVDSLEELARRAVPAGILDKLTNTGAAPGLDQLPPPASEAQALAELRALADANTVAVSMTLSRIPAGTARRANSSSESTPMTSSMAATASLSGPMCRSAKSGLV